MRDQCRWFGGMVGNHVADIVARYGDDGAVPQALTDYIKGRQGYDYNEHGRAGNTHTDFVPDEIVDRFCILGTGRASTSRSSSELKALGVDQFAVYLQHDDKEETLARLRRDRHPGASPSCCRRAVDGPARPGRAAPGHRGGGVRHNNLRDLDVDVPLWRTVAIAGVSGSGKTSLAIGTLYAEGMHRFLEGL